MGPTGRGRTTTPSFGLDWVPERSSSSSSGSNDSELDAWFAQLDPNEDQDAEATRMIQKPWQTTQPTVDVGAVAAAGGNTADADAHAASWFGKWGSHSTR